MSPTIDILTRVHASRNPDRSAGAKIQADCTTAELKAVRTELGKAAFDVAWEEGRGMKLEKAVAEALNETVRGGE